MPHAPLRLAAIDLGSNSFHLLISQYQAGSLREIARQKDMVQLARDCGEHGQLSADAITRGLDSLYGFKQILDQHGVTQITAVGTQALRQCPNKEEFLTQAQSALGCPIDIISAEREAQLVYQGVMRYPGRDRSSDHAMVIDIGGASTELIVGHGHHIRHWHSFRLGCVMLGNEFFTQRSAISRPNFNRAYEQSKHAFDAQKKHFQAHSVDTVYGASGSVRIIADLLASESNTNLITRNQLAQMIADMLEAGQLDHQVPDSLRWDVLPAGLALVQAMFDSFELDSLEVSPGSIKEGMMLASLENNDPTPLS